MVARTQAFTTPSASCNGSSRGPRFSFGYSGLDKHEVRFRASEVQKKGTKTGSKRDQNRSAAFADGRQNGRQTGEVKGEGQDEARPDRRLGTLGREGGDEERQEVSSQSRICNGNANGYVDGTCNPGAAQVMEGCRGEPRLRCVALLRQVPSGRPGRFDVRRCAFWKLEQIRPRSTGPVRRTSGEEKKNEQRLDLKETKDTVRVTSEGEGEDGEESKRAAGDADLSESGRKDVEGRRN